MKKFMFEYYDEDEFLGFLDSLAHSPAAKLIRQMQFVEEYGIQESLAQQWIKKLDNDLYEVRVSANGLFPRVLFGKKKGNPTKYIVLWQFNKKTNKTPIKELDKARRRKKRL